MKGINTFSFVVPMFNASKTLPRMLHSVFGQSHDGWKLYLIDDVSSDKERDACKETLHRFSALDSSDRVHVTWNDEKKWETANVLKGISMCNDQDIVCRLDADDFIADLDTLRILDTIYASGYDCVWTAHRWHDDVSVTNMNISGQLPQNADPYKHPWVTSHLKTFRKALINNVNDQNFRGKDGDYIKRCGDQAVYLPVLHNAKRRAYVPVVGYSYKCDMSPATFQTDDAKFQKEEAEFIRQRGYVA